MNFKDQSGEISAARHGGLAALRNAVDGTIRRNIAMGMGFTGGAAAAPRGSSSDRAPPLRPPPRGGPYPEPSDPLTPVEEQSRGAVQDFVKNYDDNKRTNWKGGDKYFHCKANCEAAQRGPVGAVTAEWMSNLREWGDLGNFRDFRADARADQRANRQGRRAGETGSTQSCSAACAAYRPSGMPAEY